MVTNREIWQQLQQVASVQFVSRSQSGIGWDGSGSGAVKVSESAPDVLLFEESGVWRQDGGKELRFTNVFRWTLAEDRLRLDHLRFGSDNPVFLFEMAADADGVWRDVEPHLCRDDCYRASLRIEGERILLCWQVRGPKRSEEINYTYC